MWSRSINDSNCLCCYQTLQGKQAELHKKRENQDKLASRIEALESKLLTGNIGTVAGNVTIEDVTKQQQKTLEARKQEIIETEVLLRVGGG